MSIGNNVKNKNKIWQMDKESAEPIALDNADRSILRHLQDDGRITNARLAQLVHLSPAACLERVRRLTRAGYIRGYHAELAPEKLGAGLCIFIEVKLDRTTHDVFDVFKQAVRAQPEIVECHMVAGGFDYLIKVRVADMAAYRNLMGASIWSLPGVRETHTYAVMEEVKSTTALRIF
jgi:Lrp/AsnC family transcriptional regulator, leucine-responsive regulatory protein